MKMKGSFFEEKPSFNMLEFSFSSKLDWGSCSVILGENVSMKTGALIRSMIRSLCRYKSTNKALLRIQLSFLASASGYYLDV